MGASAPRVVPPAHGALPPPAGEEDETSGWDLANDAPDVYVFFPAAAGYARFRADFLRLDAPSPPCVVLMTRPRFQPHVGLFWADKVLHITEQGVAFQPLDVVSVGFTKIRFYQCRET